MMLLPGARSGKVKGPLLRERRSLAAAREERIRDLGGVLLELYRRGESRDELLRTMCDEIVGIEQRLHEIDGEVTGTGTAEGPVLRCVCGTPIAWDADVCENCGWPNTQAAAGRQ